MTPSSPVKQLRTSIDGVARSPVLRIFPFPRRHIRVTTPRKHAFVGASFVHQSLNETDALPVLALQCGHARDCDTVRVSDRDQTKHPTQPNNLIGKHDLSSMA